MLGGGSIMVCENLVKGNEKIKGCSRLLNSLDQRNLMSAALMMFNFGWSAICQYLHVEPEKRGIKSASRCFGSKKIQKKSWSSTNTLQGTVWRSDRWKKRVGDLTKKQESGRLTWPDVSPSKYTRSSQNKQLKVQTSLKPAWYNGVKASRHNDGKACEM